MNLLRYFFLFVRVIWEFPQNVTGLFLLFVLRNKGVIINTETEGYCYFAETKSTGVSLGSFVFWTKAGNRFPNLVNDCRMHEYGHTRQSLIFGPFYLIVIGIPSLLRVFYRWWYNKTHADRWGNYYNGFPENWADRLGGVLYRKD